MSDKTKPFYAQKKVWVPAAALAGLVALGSLGDSSTTTIESASSSSTVEADRAAAERLLAQAEADKAAAAKAAAQVEAEKAATEKAAAQAAADKAAAAKAAAAKAAADKAAADKAAADKAAATAADPLVDFAMPNLAGANLQVAQNTVQTKGVFFSVSHDLLGMRMQALDSNWRVCTQTPKAGSRVRGKAADWEGRIDFGVVKLSETCP